MGPVANSLLTFKWNIDNNKTLIGENPKTLVTFKNQGSSI
jgi:hypothetical protein